MSLTFNDALMKSCNLVRPEEAFKNIKESFAKTRNICLNRRQKKYKPKKHSTNIRKPLTTINANNNTNQVDNNVLLNINNTTTI